MPTAASSRTVARAPPAARAPVAARPPTRPPPAALRFAYAGARPDESAVLHGLAAAYEGLFRLDARLVKGRPAYRHVLKGDRWIAFNGSAWMAQQESALGSEAGVLLLKDAACPTPDASRAVWRVTPGWKPDPELRCIGMSEVEAARYEVEMNPWGDAAQSNDEMDALAAQLRGLPLEELAAMTPAQQREFAEQHYAALAPPPNATAAGALTSTDPSASKIVRMRGGVLYIGAVDKGKRPHGAGELLLRDGSVHAGTFESGAAHGEGVYFDKNGSVHCGFWVTNFRCGEFGVVDPSGGVWDDVYDQFGNRASHERATDDAVAATRCSYCNVRFHAQHNYKCRRHTGAWQPATATRAARWSCCAAVAADEPGCNVAMHAAE